MPVVNTRCSRHIGHTFQKFCPNFDLKQKIVSFCRHDSVTINMVGIFGKVPAKTYYSQAGNHENQTSSTNWRHFQGMKKYFDMEYVKNVK